MTNGETEIELRRRRAMWRAELEEGDEMDQFDRGEAPRNIGPMIIATIFIGILLYLLVFRSCGHRTPPPPPPPMAQM